jgi:hypothetical protein
LAAVTPVTVKLALEALNNLEAGDKAISAQWRRRSSVPVMRPIWQNAAMRRPIPATEL